MPLDATRDFADRAYVSENKADFALLCEAIAQRVRAFVPVANASKPEGLEAYTWGLFKMGTTGITSVDIGDDQTPLVAGKSYNFFQLFLADAAEKPYQNGSSVAITLYPETGLIDVKLPSRINENREWSVIKGHQLGYRTPQGRQRLTDEVMGVVEHMATLAYSPSEPPPRLRKDY